MVCKVYRIPMYMYNVAHWFYGIWCTMGDDAQCICTYMFEGVGFVGITDGYFAVSLCRDMRDRS